jgi:hypothetical protein
MGTQIKIPLSGFPKGVYLLKFFDKEGKGLAVEKVVIQ